jgi:II/X family phage/plasmid replication protein
LIDTLILKSPYITRDLADRITNMCEYRVGVDLNSGVMLYEITTGSLNNSYNHKISIKVSTKEFKSTVLNQKFMNKNMKLQTITTLEECEPYIQIEGSVHKALLGHNCFDGPTDVYNSCKYFIMLVENLLDIKFNLDYNKWELIKIDRSEVFELPTFKNIKEWINSINVNINYSRRKVMKYHNDSFEIPGSTTTFKLYHKGIEFKKHDYKRLSKYINKSDLQNIYEKALKLIRVEISIKHRKLKDDFKKDKIYINEINQEYLDKCYDSEIKKVFKEDICDMDVVRNCYDVNERLNNTYSKRKAGSLIGTWYKLTTIGEIETLKTMTETTYYRHKQELLNAKISWIGTDIIIKKSVLDFIPIRNSKYILNSNCDNKLLSEIDRLEICSNY